MTGVQTCALPISVKISEAMVTVTTDDVISIAGSRETSLISIWQTDRIKAVFLGFDILKSDQIGRASCRERV